MNRSISWRNFNEIARVFDGDPSGTAEEKQQQSKVWHPFVQEPRDKPILRRYSGFLPHNEWTMMHILQCEYLHIDPVHTDYCPYLYDCENTHQIWLWYRHHQRQEELKLLFRGQFDFRIPNRDTDEAAIEITDFVAYMLMNANNYRQELVHHDHSDQFWTGAIDYQYEHLKKVAKKTAVR